MGGGFYLEKGDFIYDIDLPVDFNLVRIFSKHFTLHYITRAIVFVAVECVSPHSSSVSEPPAL